MTTLIIVSNSDGVVGRCDAKCYDAKSPACDCICAGRNHGAGKQRAIANTRELVIGDEANKLLQDYARAHGVAVASVEYGKELKTLPLFPL